MDNNLDIVAAFGKQIPLPGTSTKDQLDLNIIFRNETFILKKMHILTMQIQFTEQIFKKKYI